MMKREIEDQLLEARRIAAASSTTSAATATITPTSITIHRPSAVEQRSPKPTSPPSSPTQAKPAKEQGFAFRFPPSSKSPSSGSTTTTTTTTTATTAPAPVRAIPLSQPIPKPATSIATVLTQDIPEIQFSETTGRGRRGTSSSTPATTTTTTTTTTTPTAPIAPVTVPTIPQQETMPVAAVIEPQPQPQTVVATIADELNQSQTRHQQLETSLRQSTSLFEEHLKNITAQLEKIEQPTFPVVVPSEAADDDDEPLPVLHKENEQAQVTTMMSQIQQQEQQQQQQHPHPKETDFESFKLNLDEQ
jgi:hypothetical protein